MILCLVFRKSWQIYSYLQSSPGSSPHLSLRCHWPDPFFFAPVTTNYLQFHKYARLFLVSMFLFILLLLPFPPLVPPENTLFLSFKTQLLHSISWSIPRQNWRFLPQCPQWILSEFYHMICNPLLASLAYIDASLMTLSTLWHQTLYLVNVYIHSLLRTVYLEFNSQ